MIEGLCEFSFRWAGKDAPICMIFTRHARFGNASSVWINQISPNFVIYVMC